MNYEAVDVRAIRLYKEMTQKDLAQKLGISPSYLCEMEAGRKRVTEDMRKRLAMMFGVGDELVEALRRAKMSERLIV
jgi:transcriptional regulator with XRE-family HTH domain